MRRFVMRAHGMEERDGGGWVMYEEARELQAENQRLRELTKRIKPVYDNRQELQFYKLELSISEYEEIIKGYLKAVRSDG